MLDNSNLLTPPPRLFHPSGHLFLLLAINLSKQILLFLLRLSQFNSPQLVAQISLLFQLWIKKHLFAQVLHVDALLCEVLRPALLVTEGPLQVLLFVALLDAVSVHLDLLLGQQLFLFFELVVDLAHLRLSLQQLVQGVLHVVKFQTVGVKPGRVLEEAFNVELGQGFGGAAVVLAAGFSHCLLVVPARWYWSLEV